MSKDKIVGAGKEIIGTVKESLGKAIGNSNLESEGKAEQEAGRQQHDAGVAKDEPKTK